MRVHCPWRAHQPKGHHTDTKPYCKGLAGAQHSGVNLGSGQVGDLQATGSWMSWGEALKSLGHHAFYQAPAHVIFRVVQKGHRVGWGGRGAITCSLV